MAIRLQLVGEPLRVGRIGCAFRRRVLGAKLLKEGDVLVDDAAKARVASRRMGIVHPGKLRQRRSARDAFERQPAEVDRAPAVGEDAHAA